MEDRYEKQDNSYNMFQYTSKLLYINCLYLYTIKRRPNLFIVFKAVVYIVLIHITIKSIQDY